MSAVSRTDHSVTFRSEKTLAEIAAKVRRLAGINNAPTFNIVKLVNWLVRNISKFDRHKTSLKVSIEDRPSNDLAVVSYNRLNRFMNSVEVKLHIDKEIWELANIGEPGSRFILAHEIGHIILHNADAKAFSNSLDSQNRFEQKEYSAEWQANTFAAHLLLPDELVITVQDQDELVRISECLRNTVQERTEALSTNKATRKYFEPCNAASFCAVCGNASVVQKGISKECVTCKFSGINSFS